MMFSGIILPEAATIPKSALGNFVLISSVTIVSFLSHAQISTAECWSLLILPAGFGGCVTTPTTPLSFELGTLYFLWRALAIGMTYSGVPKKMIFIILLLRSYRLQIYKEVSFALAHGRQKGFH